jgi:gliding motility-associated-like protein
MTTRFYVGMLRMGLMLFLVALASVAIAQTGPNSSSATLPAGIRVKNPCIPPPTSGTACPAEPTRFYDNTPGVSKWVWDFAPTSTSVINTTAITTVTTSVSTVTHPYTQPGVYDVRLTRTFSGTATAPAVENFTVTIGERPRLFDVAPQPNAFKWGADTTICKGQTLNLNPYINNAPANVRYEWSSKGEVTQTLSVTGSGCYSVEVTSDLGCTTEDKITVKVCPEQPKSPSAKWYFGTNAGLDFGQGAPAPITDGKLSTIEGASSITDDKGQVLFYTDGIKVYDREGNLLPLLLYDVQGRLQIDPVTGKAILSDPNSTTGAYSLGGSQKSTQSALIVPKSTCRGCEYQYYVYTTSEINGVKQLTYSIVDMRKNDGKGAIAEKNLPVVNTGNALSTERSAAVENKTDSTYWVITRDFGGNIFRITHITKADTPTQTTVSAGASQTALAQGEGVIKIGPVPSSANTGSAVSGTATSGTATSGTATSGTATGAASDTALRPVAMVVPGVSPGPPDNTVELFTFNTETGKLEYKRTIDLGPAPPKAYGVEFSPDGKYVYISFLADRSSTALSAQTSSIIRYDISLTDPVDLSNSRTVVDESTTRQYGALQIGSDGRIYVAVQGATSLGVIENPNAGFLESLSFTPAGQSLGGQVSQLGLPNQVADFNQPPSNSAGLSHEDTCFPDPIAFSITPYCPDLKERYTVSFGDSSAPWSGTATQVPPHRYTQPGSYTAILRVETFQKGPNNSFGPSCTVVTATDVVTILPAVQSFTIANVIACKPSVELTIPASVTAQNYAWAYNGRLIGRSQSITATQSGAYTAYAFNDPKCFKEYTFTVALRLPGGPFTPLSSPTICQGNSTTIGVNVAPIYTSFQWNNGATTPITTVSQPGTYTLTGSYTLPLGAVCTNTAVLTVTQVPKPTLRATLGNPTGCTITDGFIEISPTPAGVYSFAWSTTGSAAISLTTTIGRISGLGENVYRVRATNETTCSVDSSFTLKSPANLLRITPVPGVALCSKPGSGSATLTIQGGRPTGFTWRDNTGATVGQAQTLTGVQSGTYSVEVSDAGGCRAFANDVFIRLDDTGFANLGPARGKCVNDTILLVPTGASVPGNVFQWSTGQNTPTISVNSPGSYSIVVRNTVNGCVGRASVVVQFSPKPVVSAGPAVSVCQSNQAVQLTGNTPAGGYWLGPRTDSTGRFTPGTGLGGTAPVSVSYVFTQNGCPNFNTKLLTVNPIPQVSISPSVTFCEGSPQAIVATGSPGVSFLWSNGTPGATLRPTSSGVYTVTASAGGCPASASVAATINPAPQVNLLPEAFLCIGDAGSTTLTVSGQLTGVRFLWVNTADTTKSLAVSRVGQYSLVATNRQTGCRTNLQTQVTDRCEPRAFVPTAFTPNGDGINDVLEVFTAYTTDYELRIFDRWGEVIFATTNPDNKWDGSYKGEKYPPMVYAYLISYGAAYFPDRPRITRRGSVLIIR